jgi:hypothetical protein
MTAQQKTLPAALSTGTDYEVLAQRFRPIFARIAEGAVARGLRCRSCSSC